MFFGALNPNFLVIFSNTGADCRIKGVLDRKIPILSNYLEFKRFSQKFYFFLLNNFQINIVRVDGTAIYCKIFTIRKLQ